jgi:hypothetical protein
MGFWPLNHSLADLIDYRDPTFDQNSDFVGSSTDQSFGTFLKYDFTIRNAVTSEGLRFTAGAQWLANFPYKLPVATTATDFSISFWWYSPAALGFTKHHVTGLKEPYVAPILAVGSPGSIQSDGRWTCYQTQFVVEEKAHSSTANKLAVKFFTTGSAESAIVYSEPYEPGLHLFTFAYSRPGGSGSCFIRIDVDARPSIMYTVASTRFWASSYDTIRPPIRLNTYVGTNYDAHVTCQEGGIISELIVNKFWTGSFQNLRMMRNGALYVLDASLANDWYDSLGLPVYQPITVDTNHITADGQTLYVARSDGSIIKGEKAIWDVEFTYPNDSSMDMLNIQRRGADGSPTWTQDGVFVNGATISA